MSSKILNHVESAGIGAIAWRVAGSPATARTFQATHFEPSENVASAEVAVLRTRIAELEHAAQIEIAEAYQKGIRAGEAQGQSQAQTALQPVMDRMVRTARELCDLKPKLRRDAEGDMVQLAIAIARRILHRELNVDQGAMQALVQVALGKLERQEIHRVWVHPSQAAAVKARLEGAGRQVEVTADPKRDIGSLLFETNRGKLDASVNAQFEEIERGLTDRINRK